MITGIQFILLFSISILIVRTIRRFRADSITRIGFSGWMLLWLLGVFVVMSPESTNRIADYVGVGRGVDVVVYSGLVLIFFLLFKLYNRTIMLEQEITTLVRSLALKEEEKNDNDKS